MAGAAGFIINAGEDRDGEGGPHPQHACRISQKQQLDEDSASPHISEIFLPERISAVSCLQYMLNQGREIPARRAVVAGARRPGSLTLANCVQIGEKTHRFIQHCFSRRSWKDPL